MDRYRQTDRQKDMVKTTGTIRAYATALEKILLFSATSESASLLLKLLKAWSSSSSSSSSSDKRVALKMKMSVDH